MPCKLRIYSVYELPVPLTKDLFHQKIARMICESIEFDGNFLEVHFIVLQISFLFSFADLPDRSKHFSYKF